MQNLTSNSGCDDWLSLRRPLMWGRIVEGGPDGSGAVVGWSWRWCVAVGGDCGGVA